MSGPYATILVPTHDRHATLEQALASGRAQTIDEIEILVACDGATPEVIEVARDAARADGRIRVLELPKGHNSGGVARAAALDVAAADRVFVLQDDDLWFPDHVEVLGAALDGHDVVTAATLAVRASGTVTAWVSNYGSAAFGGLARRSGFKLVFEAHYGFSLESYRRRGVHWERAEGRRNIGRLLDRHLGDPSTRWASIATPTALSFNSPVRRHVSLEHRADELREWRARIDAGLTATDVMIEATWGAAMWRGMDFVPPAPGDDLGAHLARLGLRIDHRGTSSDDLSVPLSEAQREHLDGCYRFVTGHAAAVDDWQAVVLDLLEPFAGADPRCWAVAQILTEAHGSGRACELAGGMRPSVDPERRVLVDGLLASLEVQAGRPGAAREHLERGRDESPHYRAFLDEFAAKV